jgi:transposase DDE domain
VIKLHTTPANRNDTKELPNLLERASLPERTRVFADKGYDSASNRSCLRERKLRDGIMRRKVKGKEFPKWEEVRNRAISKRRCFVEHTFGGIHLWFGGGVTRYVGVERTHTQGILEALAYNIKRMLRIPLSDE